jgi:uncharacterized protein
MAGEEKDRLGNKLRDAERGREDQYFAERDRQLVERLRREQEAAAEGSPQAGGLGRCPKCGTALQQQSLHGVSVDACPSCQGVWLAKGELQELARREDDGWVTRWLRSEFRKPE